MLTDENSALRMQIMTLTDVNTALVKQRDDALLQLREAEATIKAEALRARMLDTVYRVALEQNSAYRIAMEECKRDHQRRP